MIGLTFDKVLVIALIASLLIGPAHLPAFAAKLAKLVKSLRGFEDVDWKKLDPRQSDPRRIVREALQEPVPSRTEPSDAAASSKDGTGP
jgi:sec-independent protein translocase protein TatB